MCIAASYRYIILIPALVCLNLFQTSAQQRWIKNGFNSVPVVCFASEESGHSFVMPPREFLNKLKSGKKTSDIVIQYVNVPDSVKPAFEYAAEIWEYLISSAIPIYMESRWQELSSTTLGSCGPSSYFINFDGAPRPDTYYPVAVVEKILEEEKTGPGNPDMTARFNSTISWYLGTDGKTPSNKYDLVSTVLHEIAHGLGFVGFFYVRTSTSAGYYGNDDNFPSIFDRLVEDYYGKRLTSEEFYKNGTNSLYKALVSNQLFSGSPVAYTWYFENRPRLYAPATFKDGSSIYHLNDSSYPYGSENALMTSAAGKGEAVHTPGPLSSGIMADIGWKHLYFRYRPLKDLEELTNPLTINVKVDSDLGLNEKSLNLVFSKDNFKTKPDTIFFIKNDSDGFFSTQLSPSQINSRISYYFSASDTTGRLFTHPSQAPGFFFTLTVGPDTVKPSIVHTPPSYILSSSGIIEIQADITDNVGVDTVMVTFLDSAARQVTAGLIQAGDDRYHGVFRLSDLGLSGGDSVRYSITALDIAKLKNTARWPEAGNFSVRIESVRKPVRSFESDFDSNNDDFIAVDFFIGKEKGFDNATLNSPHPYPSPDTDHASLEFTTVLRYPIVISGTGNVSFDEVVLVEPGESGALFGSQDFYDYVIVEGSRDAGKTWYPFLDGYDSGSQISWANAYNNGIKSNNSTTAGSKDLFIKREFSLINNGNFRLGDTVLIRFRLFSDPYAHGWGWAIDNLKIQTTPSRYESQSFSPGRIIIWPNPATDRLHISVNNSEIIREMEFSVFEITGRQVYTEKYFNVLPGFSESVSLKDFPNGLLLSIFRIEGYPLLTRKIVKQ
jgi:hypothetical protein